MLVRRYRWGLSGRGFFVFAVNLAIVFVALALESYRFLPSPAQCQVIPLLSMNGGECYRSGCLSSGQIFLLILEQRRKIKFVPICFSNRIDSLMSYGEGAGSANAVVM
jgi:hypothetical protein